MNIKSGSVRAGKRIHSTCGIRGKRPGWNDMAERGLRVGLDSHFTEVDEGMFHVKLPAFEDGHR